MQTPNSFNLYADEPEYQADYERQERVKPRRSNRPNYARNGSRPAAQSGIHRRRNKRWSW